MPPKKPFEPFQFVGEGNNTGVSKFKIQPKQKPPEKKLDDNDSLDIIVYKIDKNQQVLPPSMTQNQIPAHPFRILNSGASGSGKTMLMVNLLKRKNFMAGFFDQIFLFSPTAKGDSMQQFLEIHNDHLESDLDTHGVEHLNYIFDRQTELVEQKGYLKSPKVLILFDDIISSPKFMNSSVFKKCFIQSRHINMSVCVCTQKYHSVPRICRLSATDIFFFPSAQSEIKRISEEYTPANKTTTQFTRLIEFATDEPHSFLYICNKSDRKYRKNLSQYISI